MVSSMLQEDTLVDVSALFQRQRSSAWQIAATPATERREKLKRMLTWVEANHEAIKKALYQDFKKHPDEVMIGEVIGVISELKYAIKNIASWVKPHKVPTPLTMMGAFGSVRYEAKGTVLIMAPWNYPFQLLIKPLIGAVAAGNTIICKPSELTPHTSQLIADMMATLFSSDEIAVVQGGPAVSQQLLELPFDHIFFTGSPAIGKIVMAAAAKNLSSVTLELGGKSPCIVDETADMNKSAGKIAWGKWLNNGQTCIAPDYVLVQKHAKSQLVPAIIKAVQAMYNSNGQGFEHNADYCRIVNKRHFNRVKQLIDDAVEKGAIVEFGGKSIVEDNFIEPTILSGVNDSMLVMQEEIFGPVLPIVEYDEPSEAVQVVRNRPKPLALYIMSKKSKTIDYFVEQTSAGGTVINDLLIHNSNVELPFGGVNNSGIGKSNGFWSFKEFSNERAVLKQVFGTLEMVYPPYTSKTSKIISWIAKLF